MTITENRPAPRSGEKSSITTPADRPEAAIRNNIQRNSRMIPARIPQSNSSPCGSSGGSTGVQSEAKTSIRPTWLPEGCPPWCGWQDDHREHDHYDDRIHTGGWASVIMTVARDLELYSPVDEPPSTLDASLYQHFREVEPHIEITRDGRATDLQLTLDEAEDFVRQVLRLVATGRAGHSVARSAAGCPAWCHDHEDDNHISTDRVSGPFLARLFGPGEQLVVDLVRDARADRNDRPLTVAEAEKLGLTLVELSAIARVECTRQIGGDK
ncbi:hypothetical protein ABZ806_15460 [Spirillospora sp. NPDC047418]